MKTIVKDDFTQSGWEHKETKEIVIHYGEAFPDNWKAYTLKWYNHVIQTTEKEKIIFPFPVESTPVDPVDHNVEEPKPLPIIPG